MTPKQKQVWNREHQYTDQDGIYSVTIKDGQVFGYFNSKNGEYVSRFNFEYNPLAVHHHPWGNKESAHGWIRVLGCDCDLDAVPSFLHPNDLYQWLRSYFGYEISFK